MAGPACRTLRLWRNPSHDRWRGLRFPAMITAYSMLTTKKRAVRIFFDAQRGELCRNPIYDEETGVKWERVRASNVLAAFAVEKRLSPEDLGDYRHDTLKTLPMDPKQIEDAAIEIAEGTSTGGP